MEERKRKENKREAIFTVRDAESAVVTYTVLGFLYIVGIFAYKWVSGWGSFLSVLGLLDANYPRFNRAAIALIIFKEGVDIMLRRYKEWRVEHAENLSKAEAAGMAKGLEQGRVEGRVEGMTEGRVEGMAEGRAEGMAEGRAEGMTEGRAEGMAEAYQKISAWNARRLAAEAKGLPFDEPPPGNGTAPL